MQFDDIYGMRASKDKDPLIVRERPMTKSWAKKVKEAMGVLAQVMVNETSIITSKRTSFILCIEEGIRWINMVQAADKEVERESYATT